MSTQPKQSSPVGPKPKTKKPKTKELPSKRVMLAVTYDGERYELPVDISDLPIRIDRELDLQTRSGAEGLAVVDVLQAIETGRVQRHHVCAFMFASLRWQDRPALYREIEESYDVDRLDVGFELVEAGDARPPAQGVN